MTTIHTVTVLHPGEMGVCIATALRAGGSTVLWARAGRGAATAQRAARAGLEDCASLDEALARSQAVISVCPPHAAVDTARAVATAGFGGLYVDANAIAPATSREVGVIVEAAGARFADAGIIGPPAVRAGMTRLFLSGPHAGEATRLFSGSLVEAKVLEGPADAASALKMCYAAWTKGTTALLADIRALAVALQVEDALLEEWETSQSGLAARSESAVTGNAFKAWRWIAEMHEIADSFAAQDLPDGFHRAAAEIYRRLEPFREERAPALADVVAAVLAPRP